MAARTPEQKNEAKLERNYNQTGHCPKCNMKLTIEQNRLLKNGNGQNFNCGSLICR